MLSLKITSKILLIAISCAYLCSCNQAMPVTPESAAVGNSYSIKLQEANEYITASGNITSSAVSCVPAVYNAAIGEIYVSVGDSVNEGDKLFSYDIVTLEGNKAELEKQLSAAQAEMEMTHNMHILKLEDAKKDKESALSDAQNTIDYAEEHKEQVYQKYLNAVDECNNLNSQADSASDEDKPKLREAAEQASQMADSLEEALSSCDQSIDEAYSRYNSVSKEHDKIIKEYEYTVSMERFDDKTSDLNKQIADIQEIIDNADVKAACGGIVTEINIERRSSDPTDSAITIAQRSSYSAVVHINEDDIDKVSVGMTANITFANSSKSYEGVVSNICKVPDDNQNTYSATIELKCNDELFLGRSIESKINISSKETAMMVPYEFIGQDKDKNTFVTKYGMDGTTEKIAVEIGLKTVDSAEIITDELKEGDTIVEVDAAN